jgi:hypothetical protein
MSSTVHDPSKVDASPTDARPPVPPRPRRDAGDPLSEVLNAAAAGMRPPAAWPGQSGQAPQFQQPVYPQQPQFNMPYQQPAAAAIPPWADNAVGSLLTAVLNQRRDVGSKFHMLLIPETDLPSLQSFDTIDELKAAIKTKLDMAVHVYCFMGHSLRVTKGPFHFLHTPYGAIPLHDIPAPTEDDVIDGWMGTDVPVTDFSLPASPDDVIEGDVEDDLAAYDNEGDETELF